MARSVRRSAAQTQCRTATESCGSMSVFLLCYYVYIHVITGESSSVKGSFVRYRARVGQACISPNMFVGCCWSLVKHVSVTRHPPIACLSREMPPHQRS